MLGFLIGTVVFVGLLFGAPQHASAQSCTPTQSVLGIPTWYKYLESEIDADGKCRPAIRVAGDTEQSVNNALPIGLAALEIAIAVGSIVAFVMVLFGAFKYIYSLGEADKVKSARNTIINAAIGLVITLIATRVVSFVAGRLT